MIVFDLRCGGGHVFEAWFGSTGDYDDQRGRGLIACPICGDEDVAKAVMAPNIAAKGNRMESAAATPRPASPPPAVVKAAIKALAEAQREALASSRWVGRAFAEEARAMHAGETDRAAIHGETSPAEAKALVEEGVPIAPLPLPVIPPEACN